MKIFKCKECGENFIIAENLSKHVRIHELSNKDYYDKWLKKEDEGICPICNENTAFHSITKGYRKYCSLKCKRTGAGKNTSKTWKLRNEKKKELYRFQCQECNEKFETAIKLNNHIIKDHDKKEYYDKWLKEEYDGNCRICNNPTNFTGRLSGKYSGYELCCSKECREKYRLDIRTKTNLEKYGVKNVFASEEIKQKIKDSCVKKYGEDNNMKSEKGRNEYKKSMIEKHGVEWPLQNKDILDRNQKSAKALKKFKDTNIWYQGTYELDFLEKYYDKFPDIERGLSFKYKFNGNKKVYHSDFFIPSKNLIIEIKSSWILSVDNEINEKKKSVISNGFEYLMILDKDYSCFTF